uniref:Uncharacterized protein n=1 Tax=Spironucleus salmonicida TaxID=348837 RepID=V6LBR9_9EUKA|eukprot:EST41887.1 Hypothetical protein SS50377_18724 [Spironucleus salmonicida]
MLKCMRAITPVHFQLQQQGQIQIQQMSHQLTSLVMKLVNETILIIMLLALLVTSSRTHLWCTVPNTTSAACWPTRMIWVEYWMASPKHQKVIQTALLVQSNYQILCQARVLLECSQYALSSAINYGMWIQSINLKLVILTRLRSIRFRSTAIKVQSTSSAVLPKQQIILILVQSAIGTVDLKLTAKAKILICKKMIVVTT